MRVKIIIAAIYGYMSFFILKLMLSVLKFVIDKCQVLTWNQLMYFLKYPNDIHITRSHCIGKASDASFPTEVIASWLIKKDSQGNSYINITQLRDTLGHLPRYIDIIKGKRRQIVEIDKTGIDVTYHDPDESVATKITASILRLFPVDL
jgi:hypothetical protein